MCQYVAVQSRNAVLVNTHNLTLAHHKVLSSSVVEHPTRLRRVVGSNPIWNSNFSDSTFLLEFAWSVHGSSTHYF